VSVMTPPMGLGMSATAASATKGTPILQTVAPVSVFTHASSLLLDRSEGCSV